MAKRSKGRASAGASARARRRARRSTSTSTATVAEPAAVETEDVSRTTAGGRASPVRERGPRAREAKAAGGGLLGADRDPGGVGERPQAPWHPVPVAELLILIGLIAIVVGAAKGEAGLAIVFSGIAAVVIGTLEFSVREHLSGYRAHSSLIAAVPTALLHGAIAFGLSALGAPPASLILVPLALDVPIFALLFKLLRARFDDARRQRILSLR
jgi:hypothetical protein